MIGIDIIASALDNTDGSAVFVNDPLAVMLDTFVGHNDTYAQVGDELEELCGVARSFGTSDERIQLQKTVLEGINAEAPLNELKEQLTAVRAVIETVTTEQQTKIATELKNKISQSKPAKWDTNTVTEINECIKGLKTFAQLESVFKVLDGINTRKLGFFVVKAASPLTWSDIVYNLKNKVREIYDTPQGKQQFTVENIRSSQLLSHHRNPIRALLKDQGPTRTQIALEDNLTLSR